MIFRSIKRISFPVQRITLLNVRKTCLAFILTRPHAAGVTIDPSNLNATGRGLLHIYTIEGTELLQDEVSMAELINLNLEGWPEGLYFISLRTDSWYIPVKYWYPYLANDILCTT